MYIICMCVYGVHAWPRYANHWNAARGHHKLAPHWNAARGHHKRAPDAAIQMPPSAAKRSASHRPLQLKRQRLMRRSKL